MIRNRSHADVLASRESRSLVLHIFSLCSRSQSLPGGQSVLRTFWKWMSITCTQQIMIAPNRHDLLINNVSRIQISKIENNDGKQYLSTYGIINNMKLSEWEKNKFISIYVLEHNFPLQTYCLIEECIKICNSKIYIQTYQ